MSVSIDRSRIFFLEPGRDRVGLGGCCRADAFPDCSFPGLFTTMDGLVADSFSDMIDAGPLENGNDLLSVERSGAEILGRKAISAIFFSVALTFLESLRILQSDELVRASFRSRMFVLKT
jgi:hypothetical protein